MTDPVVGGWAELELAPWRGFARSGEALVAALRREAEVEQSVYLFHFDGDRVDFEDKTTGYANRPILHYHDALVTRCRMFRDFFEVVARATGSLGRGTLAIELDDLGEPRFANPVFSFQKPVGGNTVLLPDVDFVINDYYEGAHFADMRPYDDKTPTAVFVGSTTGTLSIVAEDVRTLAHQRLRSAVFFRDHPDILFELPNIVQCDTPEVRQMILDLGVGGAFRTWDEQMSHRFILSMDGNGATCSRVVLALKANSVLLKYNSPYLLYYFRGLEPWVHYVPIMADGDVPALLGDAPLHDRLYRDIAARSRAFADRFLTREAVLDYTGALLRTYLREFFG